MAVDCGGRILTAQFGYQTDERGTLRRSARVLRGLAVGGAATDVADADRVCVVARSVGANLFDGSARMNRAVAVDDEVITDVAPAVAFRFRSGMPLTYLLYGEILALRRSRAMDDDFTDFEKEHLVLSARQEQEFLQVRYYSEKPEAEAKPCTPNLEDMFLVSYQ